jgi:hypothetical protein
MTPGGALKKIQGEKKLNGVLVVLLKAVLQGRLLKPKFWQGSCGWPVISSNYDRKKSWFSAAGVAHQRLKTCLENHVSMSSFKPFAGR